MRTLKIFTVLGALAISLGAQSKNVSGVMDHPETQVGSPGSPLPLHTATFAMPEGYSGTPIHPLYFEQRRPDPGCAKRLNLKPPKSAKASDAAFRQWETSTCGTLIASGWTHNLRTTAGTNWQYNQMAGTAAAVGTYLALTNTAITPAEADTTLSGEIVANGLARALSSPTNASTTLSVPGTPSATVVGTTGATTYYYWVAACNQGICTTPSAASGTVSTANGTLSTSNYVSVTWTPVPGAATYQVYRTTTNVAPSGTSSVLVNNSPACSSSTCTELDQSNSLLSTTIPGSNLTNFGKYTLVYTWTCNTASQSAQAFGVFNASSSGTLIFEGTFTPVSLNVNDTFALTETVFF